MSKKKFQTDFLFSNNSFIIGVESILNISGNYYEFNTSESPDEADVDAILCDWGVTGQDIFEASNLLDRELQ